MRYSLIKTFMVLMAALFLTAQGFAQAHAASNGGVDHTHDGVACDVTLVTSEHLAPTPAPASRVPTIHPTRQANTLAPAEPVFRSFDSRAPPPRGPPL